MRQLLSRTIATLTRRMQQPISRTSEGAVVVSYPSLVSRKRRREICRNVCFETLFKFLGLQNSFFLFGPNQTLYMFLAHSKLYFHQIDQLSFSYMFTGRWQTSSGRDGGPPMATNGRSRPTDGGSPPANGGLRSADGGARPADGGPRSADGRPRPTDGGPRSADSGFQRPVKCCGRPVKCCGRPVKCCGRSVK